MQIAIDGRVVERYITGIGRYILNILEEIPKYDFENNYLIFTNKPQNFVTSDFYNYQFRNLTLINPKIFTPIWLNYILPRELKRNKIDLLIGPNILVPTKVINGCRKVSIVLDIMPLIHPEFFPKFYRTYLKFYLPDSIKASDLIITTSKTSKDSVYNFFNFPESKVKIVFNTISVNLRKLDDLELKHLEEKSSLKLPEKFLLYVGVLEEKKNIKLLIQLAERLDEIDKDLKLILFDRPDFGFNEYQ